jgi:putative endonuclease
MKFYYTYVLRCADGKLYVGFTHDLRTRLKVHLEGKVRLPVELVYYEACRSETAAITREKQFKTGFGRAYLNRRLS